MTPKNKYCAFLRGVNLNGIRMKMEDVCNVFRKLGFSDVISVLATGNIIFSSDLNQEILKEKIEISLSTNFKYEAFIFLKTISEVEIIAKENPFEKEPNFHIYCFITSLGLEKLLLEKFNQTTKSALEKAEIVNQNFYWKVPKGETLDSHFGKILGDKNLKSSLTSRNLNTIETILKKLA